MDDFAIRRQLLEPRRGGPNQKQILVTAINVSEVQSSRFRAAFFMRPSPHYTGTPSTSKGLTMRFTYRLLLLVAAALMSPITVAISAVERFVLSASRSS